MAKYILAIAGLVALACLCIAYAWYCVRDNAPDEHENYEDRTG